MKNNMIQTINANSSVQKIGTWLNHLYLYLNLFLNSAFYIVRAQELC